MKRIARITSVGRPRRRRHHDRRRPRQDHHRPHHIGVALDEAMQQGGAGEPRRHQQTSRIGQKRGRFGPGKDRADALKEGPEPDVERGRDQPATDTDRDHRQPVAATLADRPAPAVGAGEQQQRHSSQSRRHGPGVGRPGDTEEHRQKRGLCRARSPSARLPRDQQGQTDDRHRQEVGVKVTEPGSEQRPLGDRVLDLARGVPVVKAADTGPGKELSHSVRCPGEESEEGHQKPREMTAAGPPAEHPEEDADHAADQSDDQVVADLERQPAHRQRHRPQQSSPVVVRQRLAGEPHVGRRKSLGSQQAREDAEVHGLFGEGDLRVVEADQKHRQGDDQENGFRERDPPPARATPCNENAGNCQRHQHGRTHDAPLHNPCNARPPRRHRDHDQTRDAASGPGLEVIEAEPAREARSHRSPPQSPRGKKTGWSCSVHSILSER